MNILFINSFDCSPASNGGVNRLVLILSEFLKEHYDYHCFLGYFKDNATNMPPAKFDGRIKFDEKIDETVFERFLKHNNIQIIQINFLTKHFFDNIPIICNVAKKHNISVVYGFHMNPGYQLQTFGSVDKVIYDFQTHHKIYPDIKALFLTWFQPIVKFVAPFLLRKKYSMPYKNCDKIVVSCDDYAKEYSRLVGGYAEDTKFEAIGNMLSINTTISESDFQKKGKEVIIIARFDEKMKRVSFGLRIWKLIEKNRELKDWKLTIIGDGIDKDYYYYLADKYNLQRVEFVGEQVPWEFYKRASIVMMTSAAEGWPMVLMGTMPMGVVPIVFDSFEALHVIINDGSNGLLIPNGKISLFYKRLSKLMLDDCYRFQMGQNAIKYSQQFMINKIANKWHNLYSSLR